MFIFEAARDETFKLVLAKIDVLVRPDLTEISAVIM